jgi:hypothetical protein
MFVDIEMDASTWQVTATGVDVPMYNFIDFASTVPTVPGIVIFYLEFES